MVGGMVIDVMGWYWLVEIDTTAVTSSTHVFALLSAALASVSYGSTFDPVRVRRMALFWKLRGR